MTEVTEYTLAVLVSTLLVGGSAMAYVTFTSFESASQADASLSALVSLALEAVEHGHSSATLLMPASTITCADGRMTLIDGNSTVSSALPSGCDFTLAVSAGAHVVAFDSGSSGLLMEVT